MQHEHENLTETVLQSDQGKVPGLWLLQESTETWHKQWTNSKLPPPHHHPPPQEKRQNRGEESHLTHRTRLKDKRSVEMCAKLSFCPLLRLSTRLWVQRTCQTSKTAKSLPWFGLFFPPLKLFLPDKSKGVYLEESEGEQGMWNSAQR